MSASGEPSWTKNFSNELVCDYYYYLSVAIIAIAVLVTFSTGWALTIVPGKIRGALLVSLVLTLVQLGIGYFIYLFAYLMCARSLLKSA
jgi:hypothetical protein